MVFLKIRYCSIDSVYIPSSWKLNPTNFLSDSNVTLADVASMNLPASWKWDPKTMLFVSWVTCDDVLRQGFIKKKGQRSGVRDRALN